MSVEFPHCTGRPPPLFLCVLVFIPNTSFFLLHFHQSVRLHLFSNIPLLCDSQRWVTVRHLSALQLSGQTHMAGSNSSLDIGLYSLRVIQEARNQMWSFRYTVSYLIIVPFSCANKYKALTLNFFINRVCVANDRNE